MAVKSWRRCGQLAPYTRAGYSSAQGLGGFAGSQRFSPAVLWPYGRPLKVRIPSETYPRTFPYCVFAIAERGVEQVFEAWDPGFVRSADWAGTAIAAPRPAAGSNSARRRLIWVRSFDLDMEPPSVRQNRSFNISFICREPTLVAEMKLAPHLGPLSNSRKPKHPEIREAVWLWSTVCPCCSVKRGSTSTQDHSREASWDAGRASHFLCQPDPSEPPIAHHRLRRDVEHLRGLFDTEPAKKAQFHHPGLSRIDNLQALHGVVESHKLNGSVGGHVRDFVQVDRRGMELAAAAPFLRRAGARRVDQNPPHNVGANRVEMRPIPPIRGFRIHQVQVCLMNQSRRLECAAWRLAPHAALRHSAQFRIHQRHHAFQRCLVAVAAGMDESGDVRWSRCCHVLPEFLQSL